MSNIIDSIQVSGVTYAIQGGSGTPTVELTQAEYDALVESGAVQTNTYYIITDAIEVNANDYVTKSANTVSGSVVYIDDRNFEYSDDVKNVVFNAGTVRSAENYYAGSVSVYTSTAQSVNFNVSVDIDSNGAITGYSLSTLDYATPTILSNGDLLITANEGYCIKAQTGYNGCKGYAVATISSGQSKNVIEDSIIPILNDIGKSLGGGYNEYASLESASGGLKITINDGGGSISSISNLNTPTIKWNSAGANVYFATSEANQVVLNEGTSAYINNVFSFSNYNYSYDDITLTVNSATTNTSSASYQLRFFESSGLQHGSYAFYLSLEDGLENVDSNIYTYADITNTFSTDYKIKITAKSGYKICYLYSTYRGITTTGASEANQNLCIVNLVTTTSNVHPGNEVIDDIYTSLSGKQDTLVSGTNIKTINNESLLGSGNIVIQGGGGGGKAISGGTNISITTGETADTINCTLPIREGSNSSGKGIIVGDSECTATGRYGISLGHNSDANGNYSFCNGSNSSASGQMSFAHGSGCDANHNYTFMLGLSNDSTKAYQFSYGINVKPKNELEFGFGTYNNSSSASTAFGHSGNTMFSIGNGYDFSSTHNWHNAFEVRQNGDIYVPNTDDTSVTGDKAYSLYPMVRLQDTITATAANTTALGGLKLVKLTQTEYDNLSPNYDSNTLYVIVN